MPTTVSDVREDPDTAHCPFTEYLDRRSRRASAAVRLPPLASGHRDPLRARSDGRA